MENPLDDMSFVKQQLEQISAIARCEYSSTCEVSRIDAIGISWIIQPCHPRRRAVTIRCCRKYA